MRTLWSSSSKGRTNLRTNASQKCVVAEAGSCLRLIDSCITQLKAQGPSRTCNESKEEEKSSRDLDEDVVVLELEGEADVQLYLTRCINEMVLESQPRHKIVNLLFTFTT